MSPIAFCGSSEAEGERGMAEEQRDLEGSPGITVKETIVPSPLKKQKDTMVQVDLLLALGCMSGLNSAGNTV